MKIFSPKNLVKIYPDLKLIILLLFKKIFFYQNCYKIAKICTKPVFSQLDIRIIVEKMTLLFTYKHGANALITVFLYTNSTGMLPKLYARVFYTLNT
jgi:hypothetical protein